MVKQAKIKFEISLTAAARTLMTITVWNSKSSGVLFSRATIYCPVALCTKLLQSALSTILIHHKATNQSTMQSVCSPSPPKKRQHIPGPGQPHRGTLHQSKLSRYKNFCCCRRWWSLWIYWSVTERYTQCETKTEIAPRSVWEGIVSRDKKKRKNWQ